MKLFADEYLARLNAQHSGGQFVKAAILNESNEVTRYYVSYDDSIIFQGHTYQPLPMTWEGVSYSHSMNLPTARVILPDFDGATTDFLETVDITGKEASLQILHLDTLAIPSSHDQVTLRVMTVEGSEQDGLIIVTLGLALALDDMLPRGIITSQEFPGVPSNLRVATIL